MALVDQFPAEDIRFGYSERDQMERVVNKSESAGSTTNRESTYHPTIRDSHRNSQLSYQGIEEEIDSETVFRKS